jgi:ABC-type transport system, involved in lipoprotein release, permease component
MATLYKQLLSTLKRSKLSLLLNVLGLSVAFCVFTIIISQLAFELGFDRHYPNSERIYRLEYLDGASGNYGSHSSVPLINMLASALPEVDTCCTMRTYGEFPILYTDASGIEREIKLKGGSTTVGFFRVFCPQIIEGNPDDCLEGRDDMIIPYSVATRLFGQESAIGRTLKNKNNPDVVYTIKLVYKDFPENSSAENAIYSRERFEQQWNEWSSTAYFRLLPLTDPAAVSEKLNTMDYPIMSAEESSFIKERFTFFLTPIKDCYFDAKAKQSSGTPSGDRSTSLALLAIAILVILISYINFVNFSTALAPMRIKSINTQKIMGASLAELRGGIMIESALISIVAFALSLLWIQLFVESPLSSFFLVNLHLGSNLPMLLAVAGMALIMGATAGVYPALYMTSVPAALALKGSFALTPKGIRLRNGLLGLQFITTIALIALALFIKLQHTHMMQMDLGYNKENVVYLPLDSRVREQMHAVTNELMAHSEIKDYCLSRFVPGRVGMGWGRSFEGKTVQFAAWPVDHRFLPFFNMQLAEGEHFREVEAGRNQVIFNQKFLDNYEFTADDVLGKEFSNFSNTGSVVGIAKDINFNSVKFGIEPQAFICGDDQSLEVILLKITGNRVPETIDYIKNTYAQFARNEFEVNFLEESMAMLYQKEEKFAGLISLCGLIAVLIALMGVYGLILFNAKYKTKEIGVRKVNGASEMQVMLMLNIGFIKTIGISFVLACPLAYFAANIWLSDFTYKIPIYWWVFALAGLITLLVTLLTVSYQSWRAATTNPVKALRSE